MYTDRGKFIDDIIISSRDNIFIHDICSSLGHDSCKHHSSSTPKIRRGHISSSQWCRTDNDCLIRI